MTLYNYKEQLFNDHETDVTDYVVIQQTKFDDNNDSDTGAFYSVSLEGFD